MSNSSNLPAYTVAIPVYNGKGFISRTLDSIHSQTVRPEKVILVDDCSTDGTADFVENNFDWVTVVRQPTNQGVASARNQAIQRCMTPVIMLLDSDDFWTANKAEVQLDFLQMNRDVSGVFCDFRGVDTEGNPEGWQGGILPQLQGYSLDPRLVGDRAYILNQDVIGALIKHTSFIHPSVICFRTDELKALGGFDASYRHIEDLEMWIRFSSRYRMGYIDQVLVVTESRPGSLGKTRIKANEGLVRLYGSLSVDYPEVASRNKNVIRSFLRVRYAHLAELYAEQSDFRPALKASLRSLKNGVSTRGISSLLNLCKKKIKAIPRNLWVKKV